MGTLSDVIHAYLSQWNNPDPEVRHAAVVGLWRPDAFTCHRSGIWRGHREIQERVDSAHREWVASDKHYQFAAAPEDAAACGNAVRLVWQMVRSDDRSVVSIGCNYLLLHPDGRIAAEYQFTLPPPAVPKDVADFVIRYFAIWNSSEAAAREALIKDVWASDGVRIEPSREIRGHGALTREVKRLYREHGLNNQFFECTGQVGAHNGVVRLDWRVSPNDRGADDLRGSAFLMRDREGRVLSDYQFPALPFHAN